MRVIKTLTRRLLPVFGILCLLPNTGGGAPRKPTPPVVRAVDGPELIRALEAYRGKVVAVNLWATWCRPCVEEFPDLVKLYNSHKARGLVVVAVSVDEPESLEKVREFLAKQRATFPAFIRKPGDMEAFINTVDPNWSGAVPATFLFDRKGKRVGAPLLGAHSYTKFAAAVERLL